MNTCLRGCATKWCSIPPSDTPWWQTCHVSGGRVQGRLGKHLPWVAAQQVSTHWLRHTTLTWLERNFGHAVARAYAGHSDTGRGEGSTAVYTRAGHDEVCAALAVLSGEPHPLVPAS